MFSLSAIICAAGSSDRMGVANKLLLPYDNTTVLNHVLLQILKTTVDEVILVLGHQYDEVRNSLPELPSIVKVVENVHYTSGHTSSIKAGLKAKDDHTDHFMICLADMPLMTTEHYDLIIDFHRNQTNIFDKVISRPMVGKSPGHPVLMDKIYKAELMNCKHKEGCRAVIKDNLEYLRPLNSMEQSYITDADTPDSYKALFE